MHSCSEERSQVGLVRALAEHYDSLGDKVIRLQFTSLLMVNSDRNIVFSSMKEIHLGTVNSAFNLSDFLKEITSLIL